MKRGRLITIGSFDGVHRGHQVLLKTTVQEAKKRGLKSLALTFKIPPRFFLEKISHPYILSDAYEKEHFIRAQGIDEVRFLDFNEKLIALRPFHFFRSVLLEEHKAKGLVVGLDFRFGIGRSAGAHELVRWGEEFHIPVWVIAPLSMNKTVVSSTLIRKSLEAGYFEKGLQFLGHPYLIRGKVAKGRGVGKKIGFPTINLQVDQYKLLPRGVFAVQVWPERKGKELTSQGIANIGQRPTFFDYSPVTIEVHLFGQPLPSKVIWVEVLKFLRSEKKFPSPQALQQAITEDSERARKYFKNN